MKFMYNHARFPPNDRLLAEINAAASRLFDKLSGLNISNLDISDYNQQYLARYQRKLRTNLQRLAYVLSWALAASSNKWGDLSLVDYGGGSGLMSLLAKECSLGTVIYTDIYEVSCRDAEIIAQTLDDKADYYVCGDIEAVINFLAANAIRCDIFVSCDVIEHIYNLEQFFRKLHGLAEGFFSLALTTHANPLNPIISRILMQKQRDVELRDREYQIGHKQRDSLKSYRRIRAEMVQNHADGALAQNEIEQLARATRGLMESDIKRAVDDYLSTKRMPTPLRHPTNTCDPITGNWADRLMEPSELQRLLLKAGFKVEILSCYYGRPQNLIKKTVAHFLDMAIYAFGKQGLRLAPYFLLYGQKI
jgi:hypothetical protein